NCCSPPEVLMSSTCRICCQLWMTRTLPPPPDGGNLSVSDVLIPRSGTSSVEIVPARAIRPLIFDQPEVTSSSCPLVTPCPCSSVATAGSAFDNAVMLSAPEYDAAMEMIDPLGRRTAIAVLQKNRPQG